MLVCTLGDLLLDVVVRLGAPLEAGSDAPAQTSLSAGGQAANVAAWAVALGARGRLVCRRGGDGAAQLAEEGLAGLGVEIVGPRAGGGGGVVVSLVDPQGDRTMASDRGVSPGLEAADRRSRLARRRRRAAPVRLLAAARADRGRGTPRSVAGAGVRDAAYRSTSRPRR